MMYAILDYLKNIFYKKSYDKPKNLENREEKNKPKTLDLVHPTFRSLFGKELSYIDSIKSNNLEVKKNVTTIDMNKIRNNYDDETINLFEKIMTTVSKYDYTIEDNREFNKGIKIYVKNDNDNFIIINFDKQIQNLTPNYHWDYKSGWYYYSAYNYKNGCSGSVYSDSINKNADLYLSLLHTIYEHKFNNIVLNMDTSVSEVINYLEKHNIKLEHCKDKDHYHRYIINYRINDKIFKSVLKHNWFRDTAWSYECIYGWIFEWLDEKDTYESINIRYTEGGIIPEVSIIGDKIINLIKNHPKCTI